MSSEHTIGYVPQSSLLSHVAPVSVREILNMTRRQGMDQLILVLQKVSLGADSLDRNFHDLSG